MSNKPTEVRGDKAVRPCAMRPDQRETRRVEGRGRVDHQIRHGDP